MPRAQRFPDSFHQTLQSLVLSIMPHITIRHTEIPEEARSINLSLANFIKVLKVPSCINAKPALFFQSCPKILFGHICINICYPFSPFFV